MSDDNTTNEESNNQSTQEAKTEESKSESTGKEGKKSETEKKSDSALRTKTGQIIDRDYVDRLKSEAKEHRLKAKEAEEKVSKLEKEKQDLTNQSVERIEKLTTAFEQRLINAEMVVLAQKEGLKSIDYFKLCDLSNIKVGENGEITGLKEALEDLKKRDPDLFQKASNTKAHVGDAELEGTQGKVERPTYKNAAEFNAAKNKFLQKLSRQ
jgi:hypothetical protein